MSIHFSTVLPSPSAAPLPGASTAPPSDPSSAPCSSTVPPPVAAVKAKKIKKRAQAGKKEAKSKDDDLSQGKNSLFLIFT